MGTRRVFDYVYAYFLHLFPKLAEEIVKLDRARSFGTIRGHHQPPDFDRPAASWSSARQCGQPTSCTWTAKAGA
jgi:hypothetical protein